MEIVKEISANVLSFGDSIGFFLVPAVVLVAIALFVFAKYSYKLFRIVLPLTGVILGAVVGSNVLASFVESSFPAVSNYLSPSFLAGIVVAALLAFFCFKFHKLTVLLIGASIGYLFVSGIIEALLRLLPIVQETLLNMTREQANIIGAIFSLVCVIITLVLFYKFFRPIYIFATSVGGAGLALGVTAIFIFANTSIAEIAVITAASIGAVIGLVFFAQQCAEIDD